MRRPLLLAGSVILWTSVTVVIACVLLWRLGAWVVSLVAG